MEKLKGKLLKLPNRIKYPVESNDGIQIIRSDAGVKLDMDDLETERSLLATIYSNELANPLAEFKRNLIAATEAPDDAEDVSIFQTNPPESPIGTYLLLFLLFIVFGLFVGFIVFLFKEKVRTNAKPSDESREKTAPKLFANITPKFPVDSSASGGE